MAVLLRYINSDKPEKPPVRQSRAVSFAGETKSRRHSIIVSQNITGPVSKSQEQLIRGTLLIIRCYEEGILSNGMKVLSNLMSNKENYSDVLISVFEEEVRNDGQALQKKLQPELDKLDQIAKLFHTTEDRLEQAYYQQLYVDQKKSINLIYQQELERLCGKYPIYFNLRSVKNQLIPASADFFLLLRTNIFRDLTLKFAEQLAQLPPYSLNFVETKSRRKKLEKLLTGLSDFDCFRWQYESTASSRSYLGAFCQSVENCLKSNFQRNPEVPYLQLVNNLWKLYAALLTLGDFAKRLIILYRQNVTEKTELSDNDPSAYLAFASCSLDQLESNLHFDLIISDDKFGVEGYLEIIHSYKNTCKEALEAIDQIVPYLTKPKEVRSGSSSSRRARKLTSSEIVVPQIPMSTEEIYQKFSLIANSIRFQIHGLEQILAK